MKMKWRSEEKNKIYIFSYEALKLSLHKMKKN